MTFDKMNNKQAILLYIKNKVESGEKYFASKFIGKDLGISSKRVGALLYKLSQEQKRIKLRITRYAKSGGKATWMVEDIRSKPVEEEQNETV